MHEPVAVRAVAEPFVVTLNRTADIDPAKYPRGMGYAHPLLPHASVCGAKAARRDRRRQTAFHTAGAYWGWASTRMACAARTERREIVWSGGERPGRTGDHAAQRDLCRPHPASPPPAAAAHVRVRRVHAVRGSVRAGSSVRRQPLLVGRPAQSGRVPSQRLSRRSGRPARRSRARAGRAGQRPTSDRSDPSSDAFALLRPLLQSGELLLLLFRGRQHARHHRRGTHQYAVEGTPQLRAAIQDAVPRASASNGASARRSTSRPSCRATRLPLAVPAAGRTPARAHGRAAAGESEFDATSYWNDGR